MTYTGKNENNFRINYGRYSGLTADDAWTAMDENGDWSYLDWSRDNAHKFLRDHQIHKLIRAFDESRDELIRAYPKCATVRVPKRVKKSAPVSNVPARAKVESSSSLDNVIDLLGDKLASITIDTCGKVELHLRSTHFI